MAELLNMPKLSDTMEEGVVASWLKKEGDTVEEGDPLAEIETDKATMEYESPIDGVLLKIVAPPGTKLLLGQPIAVFGEKGEDVDIDALLAAAPQADAPATAAAPAAPAPAAAPSPAPASAPAAAPVPAAATGGRVRSSPLARKMAKDKGLDIASVQGSGPAGRVVVKDVMNAPAGGAAIGGRVMAGGQDNAVPVSMMRQTIAKRLHAAKNEAPHFYLTVSANMTAVNNWRKKLNADPAVAAGDMVKVSVNDIVMLAAAKALQKHPGCNASWQGETIMEFGSVHMAMAVALPTGLITPVVRHCDQLGVRDIAAESKRLAKLARDGQLQPDDYTGGTFTVSNLGMFGIEHFTAIINPPQSGILAVGATIPTPAVSDKGEVVVEPRMSVTMSCDHRVIDGAMGAMFLQTFVSYLEDPSMMLA